MGPGQVLYPEHMHLNRGNHESVNMNKMYGFEGEVISKFGKCVASHACSCVRARSRARSCSCARWTCRTLRRARPLPSHSAVLVL